MLQYPQSSQFPLSILRMFRWRVTAQWLIIAFCVWHMAAVGIYSVPESVADPSLNNLRNAFVPFIRPYLLLTSQWQQWNLFSPDPLRRVVEYHIEQARSDRWVTVNVIAPRTLAWWRNADELKMMNNLENDDQNTLQLRIQYLKNQCDVLHLPPDAKVQLAFEYYVMPQVARGQPLDWWNHWKPQWTRVVGAATSCPSI